MPRKFTVIGIYHDNMQVWATSVTAKDEYEATTAAMKEMAINSPSVDLSNIGVVGVIKGRHDSIGLDSGFIEWASDAIADDFKECEGCGDRMEKTQAADFCLDCRD